MSSDNQTTAGVVGVGSMGRHHGRVYGELHDIDLVGVFDVDADQAGEIAEKNGSESLSLEELADLAEVVSIAVPTTYHYDPECIDKQAACGDLDVDLPAVERAAARVLSTPVNLALSDEEITTIIPTINEVGI